MTSIQVLPVIKTVLDSPSLVNALAKGLEILSLFSEEDLLGNQQLVEMTGLPKATVSRLTSTLVALGYLRIDPRSRKLTMGTRVLSLGLSVQRRIGLQRCARPFMEALSKELDLTVSLGTCDRLKVVALEVCRPPNLNLLVVNFDAGTHLPLSKTSIGLACVVASPIKLRTRILEDLRSQSDNWPNLRNTIERAHSEYERHGYVIAQRLVGHDVSGVAVPMRLPDANAVYAFNIAGESSRMPLALLHNRLGPSLKIMVDEIAQVMANLQQPQLVPNAYSD